MLTFQTVRSRLNSLDADSQMPGLHFAVVAAERTVFDYVDDWANLSGRQPMNAATAIMGYSMNKTVTATAVLQIVESKNLGLYKPIMISGFLKLST
jgi:CubicO group peptidase (beta-lactamase class C family)